MVHTLPCWNKQRDSPHHWLIAPRKNNMKSLMENGYPEHFIRWQCNRCCYTPSDNQHQQSAVAVLPLYTRLSDSIKRTLQRDLGIKTVIRSAWSLKHILSIPKDPLPVLLKSGIVYRIPWKDYRKSCVGQTLTKLDCWIKEHQRSVVTGNTASNALAEHCWSLYHRVA